MRKDLEKKRNDLIQDIIFQNGELHGRIKSKNILIAERIKVLAMKKVDATGQRELDLINDEIDWLKELADI